MSKPSFPSLSSLALAALLAVGAFALAPTPPGGPIEIPLAPYFSSLRTLDARVGERSLKLLFDTGGGATVLDAATARAVGCTEFGRGTGFRHDGARVDGRRGTAVELAIGAFRRRDEVGVIDLSALLGELPRLDGIASLQTFAGAALSVDLARNRVIVESAHGLAERVKGAHELRVRVAHQAAGASLDVFVALEGRHGPLWFELDSGCTTPVLVAPHAFAELGIEPPPESRSRVAALPIAGFGAWECELMSKELIYDGVLNAAFFERHVVTLDLEHARGWLRANDK